MADPALTALDQAAAALIDALKAVDDARRQLRGDAGNVGPAPFFLNSAATGAILDERAGPGVVHLPVAPIALVDRPRRSEDPRLAKANDDGAVPQKVQKRTESAETTEPASEQRRRGGQAKIEIDAEVWQACLDAYLDPRRFSVSHCIVVAQRIAAANSVRIPSHETFRNRLRELGLRRPAAPQAEQQATSAEEIVASTIIAVEPDAGDDDDEVAEEFAAALRRVRERRASSATTEAPKIDWDRHVAARRNASAKPAARAERALEPATSREECRRCGIPGWRGCEHQLPYAETTQTLSQPASTGESHG